MPFVFKYFKLFHIRIKGGKNLLHVPFYKKLLQGNYYQRSTQCEKGANIVHEYTYTIASGIT